MSDIAIGFFILVILIAMSIGLAWVFWLDLTDKDKDPPDDLGGPDDQG